MPYQPNPELVPPGSVLPPNERASYSEQRAQALGLEIHERKLGFDFCRAGGLTQVPVKLATDVGALISSVSLLSGKPAEIERLKALVQLGLKIIERGDCSCEADHAELKRFLEQASQL